MWLDIIGWLADACFVFSYFLVSRGKVDGQGKVFNLLNLAGAGLYGFYAFEKNAIPIIVLELFWGGIAIIALRNAYKKR